VDTLAIKANGFTVQVSRIDAEFGQRRDGQQVDSKSGSWLSASVEMCA
jgi:hypothetical protein